MRRGVIQRAQWLLYPRAAPRLSQHKHPHTSTSTQTTAYASSPRTLETVLRCAGVDGLIYIRFMNLGLNVFSTFAVVGFGVLLPTNLTCSKWSDGDESSKYYDLNLFMQCTLSNVPASDRRLWAHVAASYLLTFITMHYLNKEQRYYTKLRHRFLASKAVHLRTILVERIPRDLRSNSRLHAYFSRIYPGMVHTVQLSQDLSPLEALLARREGVLARLERCLATKNDTGQEVRGGVVRRGVLWCGVAWRRVLGGEGRRYCVALEPGLPLPRPS